MQKFGPGEVFVIAGSILVPAEHNLQGLGGQVRHIQLMVDHGHGLLGRIANIHELDILGCRLAVEHAGGGPLPVFPEFIEEPVTAQIIVYELVGAGAHRRVKLEAEGILHLFKDVFGQNAAGTPAIQELIVEAGVGLFQLEDHCVVICLVDFLYILIELGVIAKPGGGHAQLYSVDHVIGCKGHPIVPVDPFPQLDRHGGEVFAVDGILLGQNIDHLTRYVVCHPEGIDDQLLQTLVVADPGGPEVEVPRIAHLTCEDVGNEGLVSGRFSSKQHTRENQAKAHNQQQQHAFRSHVSPPQSCIEITHRKRYAFSLLAHALPPHCPRNVGCPTSVM